MQDQIDAGELAQFSPETAGTDHTFHVSRTVRQLDAPSSRTVIDWLQNIGRPPRLKTRGIAAARRPS